jgi:predicted NAD/FAD-binding protein
MPKALKRVGRPPSGPAGERVSDYALLAVRLPQATRGQLHGLSVLKRTPVWKLVDEACTAYFAALPADERRMVAQFAAKRNHA